MCQCYDTAGAGNRKTSGPAISPTPTTAKFTFGTWSESGKVGQTNTRNPHAIACNKPRNAQSITISN